MEWVYIDELEVGDKVIAFDEHPPEKGLCRKYRVAEVTDVHTHESETLTLHTENGQSTTAEKTHPFYIQRFRHPQFKQLQDMREGDEVYYFLDPEQYEDTDDYRLGYIHGAFAGDGSIPGWKNREDDGGSAYVSSIDEVVGETIYEFGNEIEQEFDFELKERQYNAENDTAVMVQCEHGEYDELLQSVSTSLESEDYKRGWLAGMFDTDGSFPNGKAVLFQQYPGEIQDTVCSYLEDLGYDYTVDKGEVGDFSDAVRLLSPKGSEIKFKFLQEIRPKAERKVTSFCDTKQVSGQTKVKNIEESGEQTVYDVTTTTGTLITDGYLVHQCYEEEDRTINGNDVTDNYDMDAIMEELENFKERYPNEIPGLHGGEPLLLRDEDIETIFEWVYNNYEQVRNGEKYTHIQTNATLLRDKHIEMFDKYNVNVGISCDGPPELNEHRKAAMREEATDRLSGLTYENIFKLGETSVPVGVIVVVHEGNAGTDERLETLFGWMDKLNQNGISGHFNEMLPYEEINQELALSGERLKEVYLKTWEWMKEEPYRTWNPMRDFQDNLLGNSLTDCRVAECDPFDAGAAKIIDGEGESSGCGKTWAAVGDGTPFLQGPSNNSEYNDDQDRERILKDLPGAPETEGPDLGGCKGCRYWSVCHGGCPSAGIDEDHRNRTRWCESKYYLYKRIEEDMRTMFPNIQLVTDLPWDAETHQYASNGVLDIGQFDAMNSQGDGKKKSVYGGFERHKDFPHDMIPQDAMPERTQESIIDEFKQKHGEENVTVDVQGDEVITHADSDMGEQ